MIINMNEFHLKTNVFTPIQRIMKEGPVIPSSMVLYDRNSQYWGKYLCFRLSFFPRFFLSHVTIGNVSMKIKMQKIINIEGNVFEVHSFSYKNALKP